MSVAGRSEQQQQLQEAEEVGRELGHQEVEDEQQEQKEEEEQKEEQQEEEEDDCNCRYCTGRQKFESLPDGADGMYERKKPFLMAHAGKFSEDELHRLAYFYYNTKFYGWKYPKEIMDVIGKLAEEADEFGRRMKEEEDEEEEEEEEAEEAKKRKAAETSTKAAVVLRDRAKTSDSEQLIYGHNEDSDESRDR